MALKMPFYLQNTIEVGKLGQDFTDLEEILGGKSDKREIIFLLQVCHPVCSEKSQQITA